LPNDNRNGEFGFEFDSPSSCSGRKPGTKSCEVFGCAVRPVSGSCSPGLEYGRFSLSANGDGTARLAEEDNGAAELSRFSFDASFSTGESLHGGVSSVCRSPNGEVRVGVSGIWGSWGGLIGLSVVLLFPDVGAGRDTGGAVERRWSRSLRQYEKTVEGGIVTVGSEPKWRSNIR
jgi:hypothetical protein